MFLLTPESRTTPSRQKVARPHLFFIDRTLQRVAGFIKSGYLQAETASSHGLLQKIDARIKILFLLCFIVLANAIRQVPSQLYISSFLLVLCIFSRLNLTDIYKRVLIFSFFFGFLVIAPASLNVVTPGNIVVHIIHFSETRQYWIYHIPTEIGITREGILVVTRLYLKVINSITVTLLIFSTTPFNEIIKALKIIKVPDIFLLIITMTYKFIFILAHAIQETYFALKLRWWKKVGNPEANRIIAGRMVYTFQKSWRRYEEVFKAMVARGFTGKVDFCYLRNLSVRDFCFLGLFLLVSLTICLI